MKIENNTNMANIPNGGYGWVVVLSCFLCLNLTFGILFSYGTILVYFATHYDIPKAELASIGALLGGCQFCFGPLTAALANKFGFRVTLIVGSIIAATGLLLSSFATTVTFLSLSFCLVGIGFSHFYMQCLACVSHYFSSKRAIAVGIVSSGVSFGVFIFPPLTNFLLELYAFNGTMLIYSSLLLNGLVFGGLLRPLKHQNQEKQQDTSKTLQVQVSKCSTIEQEVYYKENIKYCSNRTPFTKAKITENNSYSEVKRMNFVKTIKLVGKLLGLYHLKNIALSLYIVGSCISLVSYIVIAIFLVDSAVVKNVENEKAPYLMSAFATGNFVGRLSLGFIPTIFNIRPVIIHNICLYSSGMLMIAMTFCFSLTAMAIVSVIFGFINAGPQSFVAILLLDYVSLPNLNSALGLLSMFLGIAYLLLPPGLGYLFDVTGSYDGVFYAGAISLFLFGLIVEIIYCILKRRSQIEPAN